ncbi:hypothetical protein CYLTODRAFT_455038 [Cylindrobasidium torrendii FP15055 ss-10]|uniref:Uncharacterized protein n=1 Tax=Cylindrobasidium torrendii FP15055 ss-10 TaxID=1314674 RepID=A0A0D7B8M0_9AGAR|nr:hypothetical protein CYLTODRAFT_455038 [Cylindrobasidium torrendii FP15055 ss-10]
MSTYKRKHPLIDTSSVTRADLKKLGPCIVFGVGHRLNLKQFDMLAEQYLTADEMKEFFSPASGVYAYHEDDGSVSYFWVVGAYPGYKGREVPSVTVPPLAVEYFFPGRESEFGEAEGMLKMWPPQFCHGERRKEPKFKRKHKLKLESVPGVLHQLLAPPRNFLYHRISPALMPGENRHEADPDISLHFSDNNAKSRK